MTRADGPELKPHEVLALYPPHGYTLSGLMESRAHTVGRREFLRFEERSITWGQFLREVLRAAAALDAHGVRHGDRIAVMAPNGPETVLLLFAAARLGAILVPVNPDFGVEEARYVIEHCGACAVFAAGAQMCTARAAAGRKRLWFVRLAGDAQADADGGAQRSTAANRPAGGSDPDGDAHADPHADARADSHADAHADSHADAHAGSHADLDEHAAAEPSFEDWLESAPGTEPLERGGAQDTCLIVYTSGTTGFPKGVMHSQKSYVMAGEAFVERMHLQPTERLLCVLPLFHINALFYSLGGAAAAGATLILVRRFSASAFWRTAAAARATEVNLLAALGHILARRPRSEYVPHRIRKLYGAPVPPEIERVFREEFGVPKIIEGYGMSEIPGACNNPYEGENRIGSMGRAARHPDHAITFAQMKVIDDDGRERPDGEAGELAVRTPILMQGYYRDPEQTRLAFRDGWFLTGDLVRRDRDGYFWFVGRKKDIIRRRGENISGAELDRVIGEHPAVLEAAAIAVPSELGEDDILAAVAPRPGASITPQEIADWCGARLAAHKRPRFVAIVEALPHTPSHRIAKYRLKDDPSLMKRAVEVC